MTIDPGLTRQEELAFDEGHDADIPSNEGVEKHAARPAHPPSTQTLDFEKDIEKAETSTPSSVHEEPVAESKTAAEQITATDPDIVDFDGPDDPANPMNWSPTKKWGAIAVVSAITFLTPLASSMFAPGVPLLMEDFGSNSDTLAGFVVSVYVLGFAFGPLVIAPMSEMYGRLPLYHICNFLFLIFTIACAVSTSLGMLIGFRFLAGSVGAAPLALGGGTIADIIPREKRGFAMTMWVLGPTIGPVVGPICGGFLSQAAGWRWVFWCIVIACGVSNVMGWVFIRETYAVAILNKKTKRLVKETGNTNLRSKLDAGISTKDLWIRSIIRPSKMLIFSPIVLLISTYVAIVYSYFYIMLTTFTPIFETTYGFNAGVVGLTYLGFGVGSLLGMFVYMWVDGKMTDKAMKNGTWKPESRLKVMGPGAMLIPIGLFWYGWSVQAKIHWIMPIIGTGFVGFGLLMTFMPANTYLVDAFTKFAASAMAANTVLRSICAAVLPLAGQRMYAALGYGWGNSLLGFVAVALIPIPYLFLRYGERIRTNHPIKL